MFSKARIVVVLLLLQWLMVNGLRAEDSSLPKLNLSDIHGKNISALVANRTLLEGQLPDNSKALFSLLAQLPEHGTVSPFGDRYVSVFDLHNDTSYSRWFVYPYGSPVDKVQINQYHAGMRVKQVQNGLQLDSQMDFRYGTSVELAPGEQTTIAVLFDSSFYAAPIKIVLKPETEAYDDFKIENVIMLMSLGVCLALGIYNLFLFIGTADRAYFYYAISTFGFAVGWAYVFGVFSSIFAEVYPIFAVVAFSFGLCFAAQFNTTFLRLKLHAPALHKFTRIAGFSVFLTVPAGIYNVGLGIMLISIFSLVIIFVGVYAGVKRWMAGDIPARYFVIALLSVVVPNFFGNLINLNVFPEVNLNVFLIAQIGNSLDSLILAFALAEKVRLTNLKNIALTNRLEQKVGVRTHQLSEANEQLESAIEGLKEAGLAKNQFLASMSHEIRTPLTAIIGYAESIQADEIKSAEIPEAINIIADNGHHLLEVINDILDISKIEANKLEFESIPTPLIGIITQLTTMMQKRAQDKGLKFKTQFDFPLPDVIMSDPTRLKQILFNLTNNALKFTEFGGVELGLKASKDCLEITVSDTGIGMSESQIEALFLPFQQAEKSTSRKYGGSGLGLSISKHLVEGLGGNINVKSQLQQGTAFLVSLPLVLADTSEWLESLAAANTEISRPASEISASGKFNRAKVLVVDDHPNIRELVSLLLRKLDCEVVALSSGLEALSEVQFESNFDLVLLDIQMPEHDGIETLNLLREAGCKAPIVALTANNMQHEIELYTSIGFSSVLSKPIERTQFIETLNYYLSDRAYSDEFINPLDKLSLTRDYLKTLAAQVTKFESCMEQGERQAALEFSHAIKGSAQSFGFDLVGAAFNDFDIGMKERNETQIDSAYAVIKRMNRQLIRLPFTDLARGIANHRYSLSDYAYQLRKFLALPESDLADIRQALENANKDNLRSLLFKLQVETTRLGFAGLNQHHEMLADYLKMPSPDLGLCEKQVDMMMYKLSRIKDQFHS